MLFSSATILLSVLLILVWHALAYPMFEPRPREPQDLQELLMWSQPQPQQPPQPQYQPMPSRPEYEPAAYGYPDYGDYAEPRPAYSELDILREQLARSQPPFNKRLLPYETIGANWEDAGEPPIPNAATWYDAEVPVAVVNPPLMSANAAGLEALTEALLQVLTQQMDQGRGNQPMSPAAFDTYSEEDQDPIVEELRETAVKKSDMSSHTAAATVPPTSEAQSTSSSPTSEETSTAHNVEKNEQGGQKEVPLLRPPKPGRKPFFPTRIPSNAIIIGSGSSNNRNNIKRTMKKVMNPRSAFRRQMTSVVANEEDLTKELNSLKKNEQ